MMIFQHSESGVIDFRVRYLQQKLVAAERFFAAAE